MKTEAQITASEIKNLTKFTEASIYWNRIHTCYMLAVILSTLKVIKFGLLGSKLFKTIFTFFVNSLIIAKEILKTFSYMLLVMLFLSLLFFFIFGESIEELSRLDITIHMVLGLLYGDVAFFMRVKDHKLSGYISTMVIFWFIGVYFPLFL